MARKDNMLKSFLEHKIISEKYQLEAKDIPSTVREALNSKKPIVKTIALIVENLESPHAVTDNALRNQITQYLNEAAL